MSSADQVYHHVCHTARSGVYAEHSLACVQHRTEVDACIRLAYWMRARPTLFYCRHVKAMRTGSVFVGLLAGLLLLV